VGCLIAKTSQEMRFEVDDIVKGAQQVIVPTH